MRRQNGDGNSSPDIVENRRDKTIGESTKKVNKSCLEMNHG